MATAKHTPGPWIVYDYPSYIGLHGRWQMRDAGGNIFAVSADVGGQWSGAHKFSPAERQATARLISAAPDLLEALQRVLDELIGGREAVNRNDAIQQCRAVIAKAKGTK